MSTPEKDEARRGRLERARTRAAAAISDLTKELAREVLAAADLKTSSLIRLAQVAERRKRWPR